MVGAQRLDHRAAHQARDDGDLRQRQRQDRADLVDAARRRPSRRPAARFQVSAEDELDHRRDDEGRDGAAGGRRCAMTA